MAIEARMQVDGAEATLDDTGWHHPNADTQQLLDQFMEIPLLDGYYPDKLAGLVGRAAQLMRGHVLWIRPQETSDDVIY